MQCTRMTRALEGDSTGDVHKPERGAQSGGKLSCFLEILFKMDDLFLQRKINKAIRVQVHDSKQADRDFFFKHLYTITEMIYHYYYLVAGVWPRFCHFTKKPCLMSGFSIMRGS